MAHSLGSVIAAEIVKKGFDVGLTFYVDNVVAIGSPLGLYYATRKANEPNLDIRDYVKGVKRWINLYSNEDLIGFRLGILSKTKRCFLNSLERCFLA